MTETGRHELGAFEVGYAVRAKLGERVCGDALWVSSEHDEIRVALADGLGYGPHARDAAERLTEYVARSSWQDLRRLLLECDQALHGTRGAAVALLRISSQGAAEHCGIGNVALSFRGRGAKGAHSRPGFVGGRPRAVVVDRFMLEPGELLAVYSDGLSSRLRLADEHEEPMDQLALRVLEQWAKGHDDASCALVHCRTGP
jgi:hypothetical protein